MEILSLAESAIGFAAEKCFSLDETVKLNYYMLFSSEEQEKSGYFGLIFSIYGLLK